MDGWIKLHRKILLNPIAQKPSYLALWVLLLLKANHKETKMIWNGGIIVVKEGQFISGRKALSLESGIPKSTVEDILKFLESQHQIRQQKNTKFRLITIVNWETHQSSNIKSNNRATTERQQSDTNKKYNNEKNGKKNTLIKKQIIPITKTEEDWSEQSSLVGELIKEFSIKVNPACKNYFTRPPQRKACVDLIETYGMEKVKKMIDFLPKNNSTPYLPKATTPLQLWEKWPAIESGWLQEMSKMKINNDKNKVAF